MYSEISVVILISIYFIVSDLIVQADKVSFTMDLIHRDSKHSPFYNHSVAPSELIAKAVKRSQARVNLLNSRTSINDEKYIVSVMKGSVAEYLTKLYIGSSKHPVYALADLTSDFIWIKRDESVPPFKSDTYLPVPFGSQLCNDFPQETSEVSSNCFYHYVYDEDTKTYTKGVLSEDAFWLDSDGGGATRFESKVFGRSTEHQGFQEQAQGVIGFGRGTLSLILQLRNHIEHKFGYCLLPILENENTNSRLKFGNIRENIHGTVVTSPLDLDCDSTLYCLTLEGVSVDGKRFDTPLHSSSHMVLDIGSPVTFLAPELYKMVKKKVKSRIGIDPVIVSSESPFHLCYDIDAAVNIKFPKMRFHFTRASIRLKSAQAFIEYEGKKCFTILRSREDQSTLGSIAQQNHMVEIDVKENQVSFSKTDCNLF